MKYTEEIYSENLNLVYLQKVKVRSQIIYVVVLSFISFSFAALPFIHIDVSVQGRGIIQSIEEKYELQAPISGRVSLKFIKDNHTYKRGDTLLTIDATLPEKQNKLIQVRLTELTDLKLDALQLIDIIQSKNNKQPVLKSHNYITSWQRYLLEIKNLQRRSEQMQVSFNRYKSLFDRRLVSAEEFEKYKFDYENAVQEEYLLVSKYKNQWQLEANQYDIQLMEQLEKQNDLEEQRTLYIIRSPVDGTLVNLNNTQTGSYVFAGQKLAELSPDTLLTAVCYVKPSDIGLIKKGQKTRLQIDAFNYNQWGFVNAEVVDISNDVVINEQGQSPVFKVKCKIHKPYLTLQGGYQGNIKKGMTFASRFTIARRSIYQLLYDKVDNWLNPQIHQS